MDKRYGKVKWGKGQPRQRTSAANWKQPLKWNREAEKTGVRPRVFCASLSDWLDNEVPIEWLADLLALIHATPNLNWLMLSKRPQNWAARIADARSFLAGLAPNSALISWVASWGDDVSTPSNIWTGTTVEDQTRADERIPRLLDIPAKVRFLSCEPLLGPVNFGGCADWGIVGGESGPGAREMKLEWAESLRAQCEAADVAFFMKQIGGARDKRHELHQMPESLRVRQFPV